MSEPKSRADIIDMHKARVEECIEAYRTGLLAYAEWLAAWCARKQRAEAK